MGRLRTIGPTLRPVSLRAAKEPAKQADPIYATPEHAAWRTAVMRRAGGMCQVPGCARTGVRLFADHVVELRDGGAPFDIRNGQALCGACHSRKTAAARAERQRKGGGPISATPGGPDRMGLIQGFFPSGRKSGDIDAD